MRRVAAMLLALAFAPPAGAAGLLVEVVDRGGRPVADAVVTLEAVAGLDTGPGTPQVRTIDQHALQFDPYVEVFRPGDAVVFRNSDRTHHHVYSFSPGEAFETIVAPGESSAPRTLDAPGVVAVVCNFHDRMVTYLFVTDAPFAARTGADGRARFDALPDVAWTVRVWQPRLRDADGQLTERPFRPPAGDAVGTLRFTRALRPDRRHAHDRETLQY